MHRPAPLKLKFDNRFPLPVPSARKPRVKESFFQKLYQANWRNIVLAVAGFNALRFAFATLNALQDATVDDIEHKPRLVTVSIALSVMYAFACLIEILGVIGISLRRLVLVRTYVFLEFLSALLVTVASVLTAASFFLNAEDLMYECVALAITGQTQVKSQFRSQPWPASYPFSLREAQKKCVSAWTHESWTQVLNVFLFGFVPALLCYMLVYTYYRQTIDAGHSAYLLSRQRTDTASQRQMSEAHNGGYVRVPNADAPYAGTVQGGTNNLTVPAGNGPRSARHRTSRKSAAKPTSTIPTSNNTAHTSRGIQRANRPPALMEVEGPVFSASKALLTGSPLSFVFSPGPPTFGVNIVGPSRMGIGAYGPAANLSCSGGMGSSKFSKFV